MKINTDPKAFADSVKSAINRGTVTFPWTTLPEPLSAIKLLEEQHATSEETNAKGTPQGGA